MDNAGETVQSKNFREVKPGRVLRKGRIFKSCFKARSEN